METIDVYRDKEDGIGTGYNFSVIVPDGKAWKEVGTADIRYGGMELDITGGDVCGYNEFRDGDKIVMLNEDGSEEEYEIKIRGL
jgi:hypothetical protein